MSSTPPRVCVIGAGPSGLAALKALKDRNLATDCYEQSDRVGGVWTLFNSLGKTTAYSSLHINTSRARTQFRDFPMPENYPDFPHHSQIARYLQQYAEHFELTPRIAFNTAVQRVVRRDGYFEAHLSTGQQRVYDAVVVANGHHSEPHLPNVKGSDSFSGATLHARDYLDPDRPVPLRGKRVTVVGMGNSAMDIACELAYSGSAVSLVARRGAYIIPKWVAGKPVDQTSLVPGWWPRRLRRRINQALLQLLVGKAQDYGLPTPDHGLGEAHPTLSSELLSLLRSGRVVPKPALAELGPAKRVRFVDQTVIDADAVVFCTGYNVSFPFFDEQLISARDNDLPLFLRVHLPDADNLFFVGLCQPLGAIFPIAEAQSHWIASQLSGSYLLPLRDEMIRHITNERRRLASRYVPSRRHTMQVDFDDYLAELARERTKGERRARAHKKVRSST